MTAHDLLDYEGELTREAAAALVAEIAADLRGDGPIEIGVEGRRVTVDGPPDEPLTVEVEVERERHEGAPDTVELEVELEWAIGAETAVVEAVAEDEGVDDEERERSDAETVDDDSDGPTEEGGDEDPIEEATAKDESIEEATADDDGERSGDDSTDGDDQERADETAGDVGEARPDAETADGESERPEGDPVQAGRERRDENRSDDATPVDADDPERRETEVPVADAPPPDERSDSPDEPGEARGSLGEFQLYRDRAGKWRWRLVHRNGNLIATGAQGYASRANAEKGMRSVMRNAPDAGVVVEGHDESAEPDEGSAER